MFEIFGDIYSCLAFCLATFRIEVVVVEIPIEQSFALCFQSTAHLLFHLLHHVEAHEQVVVVSEVYVWLFRHVSVEHTLVCQSVLGQPVAEVVVYVGQLSP